MIEENTQNQNIKLCECGCGKPVKIYKYVKTKFLVGHCNKGKNHWDWKEGRVSMNNYVGIYSPNHPYVNSMGYVYEHRLVMEKHLGRYLQPEEVVHHIDGDIKNNKIENLKLFPNNAEHIRHEMLGNKNGKKDMSNRFCLICGSNQTYIDKKGLSCWLKKEDGFICTRCYHKLH